MKFEDNLQLPLLYFCHGHESLCHYLLDRIDYTINQLMIINKFQFSYTKCINDDIVNYNSFVIEHYNYFNELKNHKIYHNLIQECLFGNNINQFKLNIISKLHKKTLDLSCFLEQSKISCGNNISFFNYRLRYLLNNELLTVKEYNYLRRL